MNTPRKSDGSVVPTKPTNNGAAEAPAEPVEERDPAKRNAPQTVSPRTPSRNKVESRGLLGVREAARKDRRLKFTALLHHVDVARLTEAFFSLKRTAAVGIDGVSWRDYEVGLEDRIADLHARIHRNAYRAKPSRRVYIPKPDGRKRPLGIACVEDKIVQQAVAWVLEAVYEQDFVGFSYGFRPGRSQHDALDALNVGVTGKKVNWILDADIEGFFDAIDHKWLIKFLEHRIGDPRVLRLIRKWLTAGISEDGKRVETTMGTPQGAVISPLLANVCMHYVFDLWIQWWRTHRACRDVVVIRYADDFVIGFESKLEAEACLKELRARFNRFGLKLHEGKTRLLEFGRYAEVRREARGEGRPETFDFLGFTHACSRIKKSGRFTIRRQSVAKRMRATLAEIRLQLRRRINRPLGETGRWLRKVCQGWLNYHAVPGNFRRLQSFMDEVTRSWLFVLRRRSQRGRRAWTVDRARLLAKRALPRPRILHPYPDQRFRARLKAGAV